MNARNGISAQIAQLPGLPRRTRCSVDSGGWAGWFWQCGEKVRELISIVLPAADGTRIDRLAHLGEARGSDGPLGAVELEARRVPLEAAGGHQASCGALEVGHGFFVVDLVDPPGQYVLPVIHDTNVLVKARGDVLGGIRPAHASEAGEPARNGDVAEVAAAVNECRPGEQGRDQAKVNVIIGHLVDNAHGSAACQLRKPAIVAFGKLSCGVAAQVADAGDRGLAFAVEQVGYGLEIVAHECELTGAVNLWNTRENLFDQCRARPGKPDDENGPLCTKPGAGEPVKEGPIECTDQPGDELFVLVRPIPSFPSIKLDACQAVGLSGVFGGLRVRAASVENAGETEEQVDPAQV